MSRSTWYSSRRDFSLSSENLDVSSMLRYSLGGTRYNQDVRKLPSSTSLRRHFSTMSPTSPVIICGAGISGLALAQGLRRYGIPFRIFERDPTLDVRKQGYRVRINDFGTVALRQILTPNHFARLQASCAIYTARKGVHPISLDAITGEKVDLTPPNSRPSEHNDFEPMTADRWVLRNVLMQGLEDFVEYGKEFVNYELLSDGVLVDFDDGTKIQGSLLVGADGAKSRIKDQLLPNHNFIDTQQRWFYGKTAITTKLLEKLHTRIAREITLVQDRSKPIPLSLVVEPIRFKNNEYRSKLPEDYIYWVLGAHKDYFETGDFNLLQLAQEEAIAETQRLTSHWHPSIKCLFALQDVNQTSILRIRSANPDIPVWATQHAVTLIGDAVHAMSPTAAVGAVTALRSAAMLSKALGEEGLNRGSLRKYEDGMREVAGAAIKRSFFSGKLLFGMKSFEELELESVTK